MTRMQHGTDAMIGKIAAAIAGAFLLGGLEMFHSILDSLLIFGALHTGDAPFGYLDWLRWFSYTVTGNVLGGLLLVTLLRLVRIKDRLVIERDRSPAARAGARDAPDDRIGVRSPSGRSSRSTGCPLVAAARGEGSPGEGRGCGDQDAAVPVHGRLQGLARITSAHPRRFTPSYAAAWPPAGPA